MSDFRAELHDAVVEVITDAIIEGKRRERGAYEVAVDAANAVCDSVEAIRRRQRSIKWDQRAIVDWQNATFGEPRSNLGIAVRANVEMAELLRCLARDDDDQAARAEVADVVITLCRLVQRLGGTMVRDVDSKMEVNARRTWVRGPDGHGQHIDPITVASPAALAKLMFAETAEPLCAKCGGTGVTSVPFEPTTMAPCDCRR